MLEREPFHDIKLERGKRATVAEKFEKVEWAYAYNVQVDVHRFCLQRLAASRIVQRITKARVNELKE